MGDVPHHETPELRKDLVTGTGQDVSGLYTTMLMDLLEGVLSPGTVEDILTRAGESRSREGFCTFSCWSSHSQFRLLLEEAVRSSIEFPQSGGLHGVDFVRKQRDGRTYPGPRSPRGVLIAGAGTNPMLPTRRYEMAEVEPNEWMVREWFVEGFLPYPEDFVASLRDSPARSRCSSVSRREWSSKRNANVGVTPLASSGSAGRKSIKRRQGPSFSKSRQKYCRVVSNSYKPWSPTWRPMSVTKTCCKGSFAPRPTRSWLPAPSWLSSPTLGALGKSTQRGSLRKRRQTSPATSLKADPVDKG